MNRSGSRINGVLLGTCVGDAIGLPMEGMTPRRIEQLGWTHDLRHRLLLGRGMVSDDTEHTVMVCRAALESAGDMEVFRRRLASEMRRWFLALPPGVGKATAVSCLKLCLGVPIKWTGSFSAGNGPAMRSGILGALFSDDADTLRAMVHESTVLTHIDERAEIGALAIAELVALECRGEWTADTVFSTLKGLSNLEEWQGLVNQIERAIEDEIPTTDFAEALCGRKGVSGYVFQTVPVAIHALLRYPESFADGLRAIIASGGDTDTVGAIYGAVAGARHGEAGIPREWLEGVRDWPINPDSLRALGKSAETDDSRGRICRPGIWPLRLGRNLGLFVLAVAHLLMRWFRLHSVARP